MRSKKSSANSFFSGKNGANLWYWLYPVPENLFEKGFDDAEVFLAIAEETEDFYF
jgi:hypothetical protein